MEITQQRFACLHTREMIQVDESFILVLKQYRVPIFLVRKNIETPKKKNSIEYGKLWYDRD